MVQGDERAVEVRLSPSLRDAQPTAARALIRHVERFGPSSFGYATWPDRVATHPQGASLTLPASRGTLQNAFQLELKLQREGGALLLQSAQVQSIVPSPAPVLLVGPERVAGESVGWAPTRTDPRVYVDRSDSLRLPRGKIALVRRGDAICAIRAEGTDETPRLRSWPLPSPPRQAGRVWEPDDGPVACSELSVETSAPSFLYVTGGVEIALTGSERLGDIDPQSDELWWLSGAWGEVAYRFDRAQAAREAQAELAVEPSSP